MNFATIYALALGVGVIAFVLWQAPSNSPKAAEQRGPLASIEASLRRLAGLHNERALIALTAARKQDYFEIRHVDGQYRLEYQIIHAYQVQNEQNVRTAFRSLQLDVQEWGDGSDGWDKYIFAELGTDAKVALHRIDYVLAHCANVAAGSELTIRLQDFKPG